MKFENFELFPQVVTRYHYDDEKTLEIVAGLTSIDRKEFTDVVETFLEANN